MTAQAGCDQIKVAIRRGDNQLVCATATGSTFSAAIDLPWTKRQRG
jgi:hypothetical protein